MDDLAVTLRDGIYMLKLNVNLLSVRRMTNANVNIAFTRDYSFLTMDNALIVQGSKVNNLFAFQAIVPSPLKTEPTGQASHQKWLSGITDLRMQATPQ